MACTKCGSSTPNRVCSKCKGLEKMDEADVDELEDDGRDYVKTSKCRAIIPSSGEQCTSSPGDGGLCGTHDGAHNVSRVDETPGAPFVDLRDALVDVGLHGSHAYRLATLTNDPADLWDRVTSLEPISIGDYEYDVGGLATHAEKVARLDGVDADDHPFAEDRCIALVDSDRTDGRCTNGSYGAGLLCGTHQKANDPPVIYYDDAPDEHFVDVDTSSIATATRYDVVDERGDDLVVIDKADEWTVKRLPRDEIELDESDETKNVEQGEPDDVNESDVVDDQAEDESPEDRVDFVVLDRRQDELEDAGLSEAEAEVVALKEQGLTHQDIADLLGGPKSTVDTYSTRARSKLKKARRLVDEIGETYA